MTTELRRQLARRRTQLAWLGTALVPVIIVVALVLDGGGGGDGDGNGDPTGLFSLATSSGLNFALVSVAAMSGFLLPVVVALFAGDTVSSDAGWGSLRYLLARPVGRSRLLARKLVVAALLGLVAIVIVPVVGAVAGTVAYGWTAVQTPFGSLATSEAIVRLLGITAYVAWSTSWVAALALWLSTVTDAPVGAVASTIVLVIVVQILDAITALGTVRTWLPVHESTAWIGLLASPARTDDLARGVLLQVPYVLVFLGLAFWHFRRKDVLS